MSPRGRLFRKYVVLFVALVTGALVTSGLVEIYFSYQENKTGLVRIQREKAEAAASKIEQFIKEIESQIGWTTHSSFVPRAAALDQRRFDYLRLLRQAPSITEVSHLDATGKEMLRVSRLAMDVAASGADLSAEPKFVEARAGRTYFSPVYFRKESEPYMTIAMAGSGQDAGVTVAEVNLKFIWEVVSQIKVGKAGYSFVVDSRGTLIAHPDISLVLQKRDLSTFPQVRAARAEGPRRGDERDVAAVVRDLQGRQVLTAHAAISPLGWLVFVDLPLAEAFAPLYASIYRTALLLVVGVGMSLLASLFLARKMVNPIQALQAGAAKVGAGELDQRIEVHTGDELEGLAEQFNSMAAQLKESYAGLERKVEERTRDLTEALEQQTATSEILRVISSSPTDIQPVLDAVAENAARVCGGTNANIWRVDGNALRLVASYGSIPTLPRGEGIPLGRGSIAGRAVIERRTIHIHDMAVESEAEFPESVAIQRRLGHRTTLATPLLREGVPIGVITIRRAEVKPFSDKQIELLKTFAAQAVIAIENVRLFQELQARTGELARSVEELKALGEVSQAVSSTLDLQTVLTTIVARAVQLSGTDGGVIYEYDEGREAFSLQATHKLEEELVEVLRTTPLRLGEGAIGRAGVAREPVQIPDTFEEGAYPGRLRQIMIRSGLRGLLAVPFLREDRVVGGLVVNRKAPGAFPEEVVNLLKTFATQSVLAIQNARLFREIEEKGRQLEVASRHKSQFLANMSHELRTPLNAILGYTELIIDSIYGEVPEKIREVLERVEKSGRHLLGLINDVLDLSKIEAGQLTLSLTDYSMHDVVQTVFTAVESLAAEKRLALKVSVPPDLPPAKGDERRLAQVLLNLVGNAIKFTEEGEVRVQAAVSDSGFVVSVADTGPGIAEADQQKIFEEFQQADGSSTRKKGGTGLGLSIAKRIIELHGGRIWVESRPGAGSIFRFTVPVRVERQAEGT
jgi:signal transduction histidine kinase/HAMP domain-containing protein